jgi:TolB-like protein/Tfp pilus assembly protein PilF
LGRLFEELKRRNVFRVAIAYLVATWLVLQVADIVLEIIAAPAWVAQVFLLLFALGFPFVLIFSWAYELTPEGLKREKDVDRSKSITPQTGRKLDMATIGMLVAVLLFVGLERTFFSQPASDTATQNTQIGQNSIAVLAFEDLSPGQDQAYLAEGLSEELLNVLAQVQDLKVAGRTSSFAFKGQNKSLQEIGELLSVAHILEGSVRKSGNQIRVTAQLVSAHDGFHLFSETYQRELSDVFALQDEIAQTISDALLTEIIGTDAVAKAKTTDPEAYELFLMARQRIHTRDLEHMREASSMLDRALEIDPLYAPALAQKALVTTLLSDSLGSYGDIPAEEAMPVAERFIEQALALDDDLAEAHAVKGLLLYDQFKNDEAIASLQRALELNPTMSDAANWLSSVYTSVNRNQESREILEEIVKRDPTYGPAFGNLTQEYVRTSDFDRIDTLISRAARILGENDKILQARGTTSLMQGKTSPALRDLRRVYDENPYATINQLWYGFALLNIGDYETLLEVGLPEHRMLAFANLGQMDLARRIMMSLDVHSGYPQRVLSNIGYILARDHANQEFIDFIEDRFESKESLVSDFPVDMDWNAGYAPGLAYAYLQTGDETSFRDMLQVTRDALDKQHDEGTDNWVLHFGEAQYAALTGDVESAISRLQRAIEAGLRFPRGFAGPMFDSLRDEPRFIEMERQLASLVNAERAKLGMPPFRPFPQNQVRKRAIR